MNKWGFQRAACRLEHRPDPDLAVASVKESGPVLDPDAGQGSVPVRAAGLAAGSIDQAAL